MRRLLLVVVLGLSALPLEAQFVQYVQPGSLGEATIPEKERLDKAVKDARWTVGPLRISPWWGIRNLTYYPDLYPGSIPRQTDISVAAGAGLTLFAPLGGRVILAAQALPQYVWWRKLAYRRVWNGQYGVGMFAYFNRLDLETTVSRNADVGFVSAETQLPVNIRRDTGRVMADLRLFNRLSVYGSAAAARSRYRAQDFQATQQFQVLQLDRDETTTGMGLKYRWRSYLSFTAGVQHFDAKFLRHEDDRSSSGTAPTVGVNLDGPRLGGEVSLVRYDLKPKPGSRFTPFTGTAGKARASYKIRPDLMWNIYGARTLSFTYGTDNPYYLDRRVGVSLQMPILWRNSLTAFVEGGTDTYAASPDTGGPERRERLRVYGLRTDIHLVRSISLALGASHERYTPYAATGFGQRSYTRYETSLNFGNGAPVLW